jgi:hypothetical protein
MPIPKANRVPEEAITTYPFITIGYQSLVLGTRRLVLKGGLKS